MENEVLTEKESKVNLDSIDSKVGQLLVRLLLPVLQYILPTLSLLVEDDISFDTLF